MLDRVLSPISEVAFVMLRVVSGILFAFHGYQKLFGPQPPPTGSQIWIGGVIELVCGLLIALGLGTVYAAFLASGTMAVAYVQFHWKLQMGEAFFPAVNKGELAVVYCFLFFYFACRGAGRYSLDASLKRRG